MPSFVVELYVSRKDIDGANGIAARVQPAVEALAREGADVGFVNAVFVPDDETCFVLLEAPTVEDAQAAVTRAGLTADRIAEALPAHG